MVRVGLVLLAAATTGCGGPSSEPAGAPPGPEHESRPEPEVDAEPGPIPRCPPPDSAEQLARYDALRPGTDALHWVEVRHDEDAGQWLPVEHVRMPLHHATAIRWMNAGDFPELAGARDETLRFTFRTLSRETEHRADEHGDRWQTMYRVRIETVCSESGGDDRPEGVRVADIELDTSGCAVREGAMVEATSELAACQTDDECAIRPTPICEVEGMGCHWVAVNGGVSGAPLTEAIHRYLEEPCVSAECDCPAPPGEARCVEGRCEAAEADAEAAQQPTQTCWCFAWVHGPDHGNDCFLARGSCERGRSRRGPSGRTRACERTEQPRCERTGYHDGRRHNLGPTRPSAAALLGRTMPQLRRDLGAPTGREDGWHRFGLNVAVQMSGGRAVRIRARVPAGRTCGDAVAAEGFRDAGAPLRRRDRCEWPGISERHRLDPEGRLAGRLELEAATLEVWRRQ